MKLRYNARGCANFLTVYCLVFVEDASIALARPDRATGAQLSALARLQNGLAGCNRDQFIDIVAATAGKAPKEVYRGLLDQARLRAGKRRRRGNRPAWALVRTG